jgi:hypothetical protein
MKISTKKKEKGNWPSTSSSKSCLECTPLSAGKSCRSTESKGYLSYCGNASLFWYHIMILITLQKDPPQVDQPLLLRQNLGAKTIFESNSLWRQLLPLYFLIWFSDLISHTFVLFKDVTLTWINYLETWCIFRKWWGYFFTSVIWTLSVYWK